MGRRLAATVAVAALVTASCTDDDNSTEPETGGQNTAEDQASPDEETVELPDEPAASSFLYAEGVEPAVGEADDDVTVTWGDPVDAKVPFLAVNGTEEPVSRVEVSGTVVDGQGETITSGASQSVQPNVVEPGEVAFGFVYAGAGKQLPDDAAVDSPNVDYRTGLGDFENIIALEIEKLERVSDGFTGSLTNPHELDVDGPIDVTLACLNGDGELLDVLGTFADRDSVEAGGTATFTVDLFGDEPDCDGLLAGSSGYDPNV